MSDKLRDLTLAIGSLMGFTTNMLVEVHKSKAAILKGKICKKVGAKDIKEVLDTLSDVDKGMAHILEDLKEDINGRK